MDNIDNEKKEDIVNWAKDLVKRYKLTTTIQSKLEDRLGEKYGAHWRVYCIKCSSYPAIGPSNRPYIYFKLTDGDAVYVFWVFKMD